MREKVVNGVEKAVNFLGMFIFLVSYCATNFESAMRVTGHHSTISCEFHISLSC
jgi:hypothetical protein